MVCARIIGQIILLRQRWTVMRHGSTPHSTAATGIYACWLDKYNNKNFSLNTIMAYNFFGTQCVARAGDMGWRCYLSAHDSSFLVQLNETYNIILRSPPVSPEFVIEKII